MERFQGARSPPEIPINSPVAMGRGGRLSGVHIHTERDGHKREIINRERELDSSSQLAAYKLLFAYLLFLEFLVDGAKLLPLPTEEKIPDGPNSHPVNGEQDSLSTATRRTQH